MIKLVVLWNRPADEAGFDAHYLSVHKPLVEKLPGLRAFEVARVAKGDIARIAQLTFADADALKLAMGSEAGAAVTADGQLLQERFAVSNTVLVATVNE